MRFTCPACGSDQTFMYAVKRQRELVKSCMAPKCGWMNRQTVDKKELEKWSNDLKDGWTRKE
jgi:uncharacterized Zn finger protein